MKGKQITTNFSSVNLTSYERFELAKDEVRGQEYFPYGIDNLFPNKVYDIYMDCGTLQSIINGSAEYTFGNGIEFNTPQSFKQENVYGDTLEDVVEKLIIDLWIFGGFAFQVQYNKFGNITELIYLDFRNVRSDKKGYNLYYYDKWGKWGQGTKALKFNCFDLNKGAEDGSQIFYYKGKKTRDTYPLPDYYAALVSAQTQIKIQRFNYATVSNNFMVNGILNFNNAGNVEDENKLLIEAMVNEKFCGEDNAARLMISWNEDKNKGVTFERISSDDFDKQYTNMAESTRENLFISLRANPILFGLPASTGFADQNYAEAFSYYNDKIIKPKQKEITRVMDKVFGVGNLTIKPLTNVTEQP